MNNPAIIQEATIGTRAIPGEPDCIDLDFGHCSASIYFPANGLPDYDVLFHEVPPMDAHRGVVALSLSAPDLATALDWAATNATADRWRG